MTNSTNVLDHLLSSPPHSERLTLATFTDKALRCPWVETLDRALFSGFEADRLGFAFTGGYRAALDHLFEHAKRKVGSFEAPSTLRLSLAATETGGAHPRAIETTLTSVDDGSFRLRGEKTFATLASAADEMLVVASRGSREGKNELAVVRIPTNAPGVTIEDRAPTPFAPEIPHARVKLDDVLVPANRVLPGDGYDVYLKPFRTIEDMHVLAGALGYLVRVARLYRMNPELIDGSIAAILALRGVGELDASDPRAHLALSGIFTWVRRLVAEHDAEWTKAPEEERTRWHRDLGLLMVAENVRQKRTEAARKTLSSRSS